MKIYTKNGDKGLTSLYGSSNVSKAAHEFVIIGHIDKLNAVVGLVISQIQADYLREEDENYDAEAEALVNALIQTQYELFCVGAELGTAYKFTKTGKNVFISESEILDIEKSIDEYSKDLPELKNFILPGGHLVSSNLHLCRAICRDAEREICWGLQELTKNPYIKDEMVNIRPVLIKYFNRLSDWFFTVARFYNYLTETPEELWVAP